MRRLAASVLGVAGILAGALLAPPALSADRDALRQIVEEQCLVHWRQRHDPAPCEQVDPGYAVLADRKGGAHFLLIPTTDIAGIESPQLLETDAPNYFSSAWRARDRLAAAAGRRIPRSAVGLAVNPAHARTQDQLHIHIECLRPDVFFALKQAGEGITSRWSPLRIGGARFDALRIPGEDLNGANPFRLLAERILAAQGPQAGRAMGDYTLVVAGMQFESGPGFVLLAGTDRAGELLLDSTCSVAGA